MGDDALNVAHDAKNLATKAMTHVELLQPQLKGISDAIAEMRRENTEQHRENSRVNKENFEQVHSRISSVKQTIDTNRNTSASEIKALDEKLTSRITKENSGWKKTWEKHRDKAFWLLAAFAIGLVAQRLGVSLPGIGQ